MPQHFHSSTGAIYYVNTIPVDVVFKGSKNLEKKLLPV